MKVLVCPLNWGLGHATRCIPVIQEYIDKGHEVIIAADGHPESLLRGVFPALRFLHLPSYNIQYQKGNSQLWAMFVSLPQIFSGILKERKWIKKMMQEEKFNCIISDNRFGLWHKKAQSIYMTHQLMIKMPGWMKWAEPIVWLGHRFFITRYNQCLIPDFAGIPNLSGDLSHLYPLPANAVFIGPLSRFSDLKAIKNNTYKTIGLVSGPEPTRTIFENYLIHRLQKENANAIIVRGLPSNKDIPESTGVVAMVNHLPADELAPILLGADKIICRSGYTTIMDLHALNCLQKAEFHPTPGQTEQEYLAILHKKNSI